MGRTPPSVFWGKRIPTKGQFPSKILYRQVHCVQHCSAGPAQSRQKYPKIGQISGFLIFLDKSRPGGTPPPYFGAVEIKKVGHFSPKSAFC